MTVVDLEALDIDAVDMLTLVIVGSSETRRVARPMVASGLHAARLCGETLFGASFVGGRYFAGGPNSERKSHPGLAEHVLSSCRCRLRPDQAVTKIPLGAFLPTSGAERVVELVFPDETPFAQAPVLKWDHLPTVLVLIEDNVSEDVRTQLDTELQELERRLPLKSLVKKQIPDAATDLPSDAF